MNAFQAHSSQDMRTLLKSLGMGDFNATMVIPYMFMAPAQCDPAMAQVILMIEGIQRGLNRMGAQLEVNGVLTQATIRAMKQVVGATWPKQSWGEIYYAIAGAIGRGVLIQLPETADDKAALAGIGFIPPVPGGNLGIMIGAGVALYFLLRKKR